MATKPAKKGYVTLTLAHPLNSKEARKLGLEPTDEAGFPVGAEVELHPARARDLIGAGYAAGVNPQDHTQVREALGLVPAAAPAATAPVSDPASGNPPASASAAGKSSKS